MELLHPKKLPRKQTVNPLRIGLDLMGSDLGPQRVLEGLNAFLGLGLTAHVVVYGNVEEHQNLVDSFAFPDHVSFEHCTEAIEMGEHPAKAVMRKTDSSIVRGFADLKARKIDAYASTGNTGAMMTASMMSVKTIPGVIRPAIASAIPRENGQIGLLMDVGANADCKPDYLFQFGIMGHWYAKTVLGIDSPKVGLINIGEEEEKGSLLCQAAYKMMKDNDLFQFIGNIEGRDMFSSDVDVMVTDGFTGNVMLKLTESFYRMIRMRKIQDDFFKQLNYEIYGGSPILGVNGNVIIGHGSSSATAIGNMIAQGYHMAQHGLREKIETAFQ